MHSRQQNLFMFGGERTTKQLTFLGQCYQEKDRTLQDGGELSDQLECKMAVTTADRRVWFLVYLPFCSFFNHIIIFPCC